MSGAKKASARASVAMRGPSRQITARLIAGAAGAGGDGAREVGEHQPFGAVGDAGKKQRPAGRETLRRRPRRRSHMRRHCFSPARVLSPRL